MAPPTALSGFAYTSGGFFDPGGSVEYVVDDFEDGTFYEYDRIDQPWEITTDASLAAGLRGLDGDGPGASTGGLIISGVAGDGPVATPQIGDTITFDWRVRQGDRWYFLFGAQDLSFDNRYQFSVNVSNDVQRLQADLGGTIADLSISSATFARDRRYRTIIRWLSDRSFEVTTVDRESGVAAGSFTTDPDTITGWEGGRFGWYTEPTTRLQVDRLVVSRPVATEPIDSFDGGIDSRWVRKDFDPATDRVYSGTGSARSTTGQPGPQASYALDIARRPTSLTAYIQETGNSTGQGIRFRNSSGQYELGVALDNPEWDIDDANGPQQVFDPANGYDHWVELMITFNWEAGTADVFFRSLSDGVEYTATTRPLVAGIDIATIEVWAYNSGAWGDSPIDAWFDEITTRTGQRTIDTRPRALEATDIDYRSVLVRCNAVGPFTDFYRAEASGTAVGDYTLDRADDSNAARRSEGLEEGERYYFRAANANSAQLSNETAATTLLRPPGNLSASTRRDPPEVRLAWAKQDNSSDGGHRIIRDGSVITTVGPAATRYADTTATPGERHTYAVRRYTDHAQNTSGQVSATIPVARVVDSFEGGRSNLSPWDISTTTWGTVTRNASDGSRAMNIRGFSQNNPAGHDGVLQNPVDGYPSPGNTIEMEWVVRDDDRDHEFWFGFQNYNNYNYVSYNGSSKELHVGVRRNGTRFIEDRVAYDAVQGQMRTATIDWRAGTRFFFDYDGRSLDSRAAGRSNEYGAGKVGLRAQASADVDVDWIRYR